MRLAIGPPRQPPGGAPSSWESASSSRSRRNTRRSHDASKRWRTTRARIPPTGGAGKPRNSVRCTGDFNEIYDDRGHGHMSVSSVSRPGAEYGQHTSRSSHGRRGGWVDFAAASSRALRPPGGDRPSSATKRSRVSRSWAERLQLHDHRQPSRHRGAGLAPDRPSYPVIFHFVSVQAQRLWPVGLAAERL